MPRVEAWRPDLEREASQVLGVRVSIGSIEVSPGAWSRRVTLRDVALADAAGHPDLRLPRVDVAVSPTLLIPTSLAGWTPRFEQVVIDAPALVARRDARGHVQVAGIDFGRLDQARSGGPSLAADWLFSQREFVIRGGTVSWSDELHPGADPLTLTAVDIAVRNRLGTHEIRVDATPPADWGQRFSARGRFRRSLAVSGVLAAPGDWRHWSGSAYLELPLLDLSRAARLGELPLRLDSGEGRLRAWLDVHDATLDKLTADVRLASVDLRLGEDLKPLSLRTGSARLEIESRSDRLRVAATGLEFESADGVGWAPSNLSIALHRAPDGSLVGGQLNLHHLDLAVLAHLSERVPLPVPTRHFLASLSPRGHVQDLVASWSGPVDAPDHYSAQGRVDGLWLAAQPGAVSASDAASVTQVAAASSAAAVPIGRPGLRQADVEFDASETGGTARLGIAHGALEFPGVFADPVIPIDQLSALADWRITARKGRPPALEVRVRNARFANADARGEASGTWCTGEGDGSRRGGYLPGVLDLDASLTHANAARTARYLPLGIAEQARDYVARSVLGGDVRDLTARVHGDLWDFPFAGRADADFRIRAHIDGATYAFAPARSGNTAEWPTFTGVRGDLLFERSGMSFHDAHGVLAGVGSGGLAVHGVSGSIEDFGKPVLRLQGRGAGKLSDALALLAGTPIGEWTHGALAQATATGDAALQLALAIPLDDPARTSVKGSVSLADNDIRLLPATPLLDDARAQIEFSEKGFTLRGGRAKVLGGDASFQGGSLPDGSVRFDGGGNLSASTIRRDDVPALLAPLAAKASGATTYRVWLSFGAAGTSLVATSSLQGLALDLPVPLGKPADAALPLRVEMRPSGAADAARADEFRVDVGKVLAVRLARDSAGPATRPVRGTVVIGPDGNAAVERPERGVLVLVNLPSLSIDDWRARLDLPDVASADAAGGGSLPLEQLQLKARELVAFGRSLTNVDALVTPGAAARPWRTSIVADQMRGTIEYTPPASAGGVGAGLVQARLARLTLPRSDAQAVESALDARADVPALDIDVDDFVLHDMSLGRLEVRATNRGPKARREWVLSRFALSNPQARLDATGQWSAESLASDPAQPAGARRRLALDFKLTLNDSGALLERLGFGKTLNGGKGTIAGKVAWLGSPFELDYPTLTGSLGMQVERGQFLKVDPGAARLLGVLNLQALPRRLALDFRDVFQQGFAFDSIAGDVDIDRGVARTRNLRMKGVQALVLMDGSADIGHESQDMQVWVVPEINAGTASLAYAFVNPAVGLSTFLGQLFLRKPLAEAATRQFHVTGPWSDPKVERVEHRTAAPTTELGAADGAADGAAAASSPATGQP